MGFLVKILGSLLIVILAYKVYDVFETKATIPVLEETWWGGGDPSKQDTSIRPFQVKVSDEVLKDLKYRLEHAVPFTPPLEGTGQQYGFNTNLLREIVDHWRTKYDWKEREKLFNQYPQFVTNIQGLDIHYIHVKPPKTNLRTLPLLIVHGWPGSVREFYEAIPLLTRPQKDQNFVFELIIPSIPGYGYSQAAQRPGLGAAQMAVVFKNLMERLGFDKYYAQGGDFGAVILQNLAVLYPDKLYGFHSNMCTIHTPLSYLKTLLGALWPTLFTREDHVERVYPLWEKFTHRMRESGYMHLQATKPDTIGVALRDSPVGLAAYMLEKFATGCNITAQHRQDGGLKECFDYDDLLDNVMLYWVTGSMPTAIRLYAETLNKAHRALGIGNLPITVPTACARFRNDFYTSDGLLSEIYKNLLHLSDYEGGHFAAFQLPETYSRDVFLAVEKFERFNYEQNS